ncbi:MAG: HNH endonuclease signature motif containing protein [Actinomadura sp.]
MRLRKAIIEADPQAFQERRKTAEKGRRLEQYTNPDGTSDLAARDLPTEAADAAYNYVNALAAALKADGDERPIDAIRADVALDLLRGRRPAELFATDPDLPDPAPAQTAPGTGDTGRQEAAAITSTVRARLTELHDQVLGPNRPVEHWLLIAEAARRIKDALAPLKSRWCHLAADTIGDLVHGHDGYWPPEVMRRLIQARNGTCTFPTCRRNVMKCDLDHTIPYHKGGPTCPCNIAPLCRGHHMLKQHPDWTLVQLWPGVLLWTSPTGHWYLVGPDP